MGTVRNVTPPNFPIAPDQYDRRFHDQFINVLRLFLNGVANAINAPKIHGSYYSTELQTNPVANTANLMTVNNTVIADGTKVGSPASRIYVADTGVYNIQFSVQLDKASGSSAQSAYIWLRIDGQDVPYSASQVTLKDASSELVAAWNFVVVLKANSYFELVWSSPDTDMQLKSPTASAPVPGIPSVILTVTWVSNVPV